MVSSFRNRQSGAALILIAFILGLGVTAYLIKTMSATTLAQQQDEKTYKALDDAKAAVIAWAVTHPNLPGLMPYPDRNSDGNYDDTSDCYATNVNFATNFVLGRLPLYKNDPNCVSGTIATVTNGLGGDFRDGTGERLWYEVSRNLLYDYKTPGTAPIINPAIVNNPNYAWMTVRDRNGVLISNRVAAVIIAPGSPSGTQDRSGGLANANQYLDKVVMADGTPYQNYGYPDPATNPVQEFIMGDDYRTVAKNDPTYKNQSSEPYYFNDKVVYITIDELIAALEQRVAAVARVALQDSYTNSSITPATRFYPYAAAISSTTNPNQCVKSNLQGLLPVNAASTYNCNYSSTGTTTINNSVNCSFSAVSSVSFNRTSGTYGASSGACTMQNSNTTCTCTGAGSCNTAGGTVRFSCDACGVCSTNSTSGTVGQGKFSFTTNGIFSSTGTTNLTLSNDSTGSFTLNACSATEQLTTLPAWFTANSWQDYVYYQTTRPTVSNGINAGTKKSAAILITVGAPIVNSPYAIKGASQVRTSSCNLNDYMDTIENINSDNVFEATNKIKSQNYNDQVFLVNP